MQLKQLGWLNDWMTEMTEIAHLKQRDYSTRQNPKSAKKMIFKGICLASKLYIEQKKLNSTLNYVEINNDTIENNKNFFTSLKNQWYLFGWLEDHSSGCQTSPQGHASPSIYSLNFSSRTFHYLIRCATGWV